MKAINYEINEDDIRKYLHEHRKSELLKYKEALFVDYIKNTKGLTKEKIDILIKKYNISNCDVNTLCFLSDNAKTGVVLLEEFSDHLSKVSRLDINGICHMLIPIIKNNGYDSINRDKIKIRLYRDCLLHDFGFTYASRDKINDCVDNAIDNYSVANKVKATLDNDILLLSKNNSQLEMKSYSELYGKDVVKTINNHVNLLYKDINKF